MTTTKIELQRDNTENSERQFDAAVYTAARIFNPAALPDDMPDFIKDAIDAKAEQAKLSAQEAGFIMPDAGKLIDGKTVQERERDNDEENRLYVASIIEEEDRRQQEREEASYQQWRQERHTYAGQTMDGEDWHRLINWFRDPGHVAEWEDAMMAKTGQTREEVRETGGKMKRWYDLMEKDGRGTMTKDERAEFEKLDADKELRRGVEVQQEIQGQWQTLDTKPSARNEQTSDATQRDAAVSFASTLNDDGAKLSGLSTAASLVPNYQMAALGKPAVTPVTPSAPSPSQTVTVSPDNMFG